MQKQAERERKMTNVPSEFSVDQLAEQAWRAASNTFPPQLFEARTQEDILSIVGPVADQMYSDFLREYGLEQTAVTYQGRAAHIRPKGDRNFPENNRAEKKGHNRYFPRHHRLSPGKMRRLEAIAASNATKAYESWRQKLKANTVAQVLGVDPRAHCAQFEVPDLARNEWVSPYSQPVDSLGSNFMADIGDLPEVVGFDIPSDPDASPMVAYDLDTSLRDLGMHVHHFPDGRKYA